MTRSASVTYGPAAPSKLTATAISSRQVNLAWTNNAKNQTGFVIQRSSNRGSSWVQIATVGANATTYSDTTVQKKHTYEYRVAASNSFGNSAWSNTVTVTSPTHDPSSTDGDQPIVWVGPVRDDEAWRHSGGPWDPWDE